MRIVEDGEIQFRGPTLFKGYWEDPEATRAAYTEDGWYRTGDLGRLDAKGRLVLHGRKRDMIVLPNGFNVFPEDIEIELREAGIRDSVVLETEPGRIEAVCLAPAVPIGGSAPSDEQVRETIAAAVKRANAALGPNQRIAGWRLWPEADFPRTHTLKIKRDPVRAWAKTTPAG
jgi:long-chain acyl-CoA synthetase